MWWFWWWMLFVVIFLLFPVGYGWGYRRWGAPYPSWYRNRRVPPDRTAVDPAVRADTRTVETGWGVFADVIFALFLVALIWLVVAAIL